MPDIKLNFAAPVNVADHFTVPADDTPWPDQHYTLTPDGSTPTRARAAFRNHQNSLVPATETARSLANAFGVYVLSFDVPYRAVYVGVAGCGGRRPEGVLSRLGKHRVKATGSHIGRESNVTGAVNHTVNWRRFAADRYRHFAKADKQDTLTDMRWSLGTLEGPEEPKTLLLEHFEHALFKDQSGVRTALVRLLWPDVPDTIHFLLTARSNQGALSAERAAVVTLWNGVSTWI